MLDLTRCQRQEETSMQEEADRPNEEDLTEDDVSKTYAGRWWDREERKYWSRATAEPEAQWRGRERNKNDASREGHKRTAGPNDEKQGRSRQGEMAMEQLGIRLRTEPPRRQRGENIRGTGRRGSMATGSNREDVSQDQEDRPGDGSDKRWIQRTCRSRRTRAKKIFPHLASSMPWSYHLARGGITSPWPW
jgi:hypothetical protein